MISFLKLAVPNIASRASLGQWLMAGPQRRHSVPVPLRIRRISRMRIAMCIGQAFVLDPLPPTRRAASATATETGTAPPPAPVARTKTPAVPAPARSPAPYFPAGTGAGA